MDMRIGYVIVGVKALEPAIAFYRDVMGFQFLYSEPEMHWAAFKVGGTTFNLAEGVEETHGAGDRNTGIGFMVPDLDAAHAELSAKGVRFTMGPGKMPWGGSMAMFVDPDGNEFYLNPEE
jgi:catechol 2,3-dioxygenase-like lactoylglutathione lyase family enzyme